MNNNYLSVKEITQYLKDKFDNDSKLSNVLLKGELSNLFVHSSGHVYFTLKDDFSQISAVMFSSRAKQLKTDIKNGDNVLISGNISVYQASGKYQIYVDTLTFDGVGDIFKNLEILKNKLSLEGVFDKQKRLTLPKYPKRIALVTSNKTAAYEDVINTISKRYKLAEIRLYDTLVQGVNASKSIVTRLNQIASTDSELIILSRGGGSAEDLWCFNDEELARTISELEIPVITGIGHEIDYSLADFAACYRALTPTDAAVKATPLTSDLQYENINKQDYLNSLMKSKIENYETKLNYLKSRKIISNKEEIIKNYQKELSLLEYRLNSYKNNNFINQEELKLENKLKNLQDLYINKIVLNEKTLNHKIDLLESLNPLNIIKKGYGLIKSGQDLVTSVKTVKVNQNINIKLKDGYIDCIVTGVKDEK